MNNTFTRHGQLPLLSTFMPVLLLAVAVLLSGCVQKYYTVNQYGLNTVDSEVLKEESITPTVKASLK